MIHDDVNHFTGIAETGKVQDCIHTDKVLMKNLYEIIEVIFIIILLEQEFWFSDANVVILGLLTSFGWAHTVMSVLGSSKPLQSGLGLPPVQGVASGVPLSSTAPIFVAIRGLIAGGDIWIMIEVVQGVRMDAGLVGGDAPPITDGLTGIDIIEW
jgi:hypothetical protein